jgi:elongation factor 1-alpha
VIGHVDQGKSSIAGCLTYHLCLERRAKFDSLQYLAKSWSPGETSLSWVTDRVRWKMPRDRGPHHSSEAQLSWLETQRYRVSLFDTPGRRADVPNAIRGARVSPTPQT